MPAGGAGTYQIGTFAVVARPSWSERVLVRAGVLQGGAANAGPQGVGAVGLQGGTPPSSSVDLKALEGAARQLQALSLREPRDKKDRKKDKKAAKKKQKKDKKKSKKKKKDSSSRKSKHVKYDDLSHVDGLKWKKKGDLVAFAAKHPGALTAHFLAGVYARLSKGTMTRTSQLREASVAAWAHQFTGLSEIRDLKEVLTLAEILDSVNRREIERAMDILCQRILAIQVAKMKGGSWEKAEAIELVNTQKSLASSSMLALTNA
ncbi:unnamed protein product [Symbiodinium sp. CCMP2592]|nr:unnamed protein product [Symbiodinium sp. CCMP2592]